jgi:hypothetical protein
MKNHYPLKRNSIILFAFAEIIMMITMRKNAMAENIITVDMHTPVVSSFMGLGIQWDPYAYQPTPAKWKLTLARLDRCKPGFFRVCHMANDYCIGFNAKGNPIYVWDKSQKSYPQAKDALKQLYAILNYAQSRNVTVILGEWGPGRVGNVQLNSDDHRWARIMADFINHLINTKHYTVVKYINNVNEPNGDWSGNKSYDTWVKGIRYLHTELKTYGLDQQVHIIGPDTTGNTDWLEPFTWIDRTAKDIPGDIGAYDLHWYAQDKEVLDGAVEQLLQEKREIVLKSDTEAHNKPMFMGESGLITGRVNGDQQPRVRTFEYGVMMADYAAQVGRAGWMGATAWDCDDAMHTNEAWIPVPNKLTLKLWGFWNTQGSAMGMPEDELPRPWFYTWTLMSRLFPKGSLIVKANNPALPRFRVLAGADTSHKKISIMLVNNADAARTVLLRIPGGGSTNILRSSYFQNDHPEGKDNIPLPADHLDHVNLESGIEVLLPSRGVVFLTTQELKL